MSQNQIYSIDNRPSWSVKIKVVAHSRLACLGQFKTFTFGFWPLVVGFYVIRYAYTYTLWLISPRKHHEKASIVRYCWSTGSGSSVVDQIIFCTRKKDFYHYYWQLNITSLNLFRFRPIVIISAMHELVPRSKNDPMTALQLKSIGSAWNKGFVF